MREGIYHSVPMDGAWNCFKTSETAIEILVFVSFGY
jgi:hypothetical protein